MHGADDIRPAAESQSLETKNIESREDVMHQVIIAFALCLTAGPALAQTKEPITLRDMGSFHVGGRVIDITGQPIKEVVFTPGGVPAKVDPNGKY
jgi:hypothetical protein